MTLNGIDVSSNQPANIGDLVDYDFMIVKASGNPVGYDWNYTNLYMVQQVESALAKTGCAGLYHFTYGEEAEKEADFFCSVVKLYVGRAMLIIDYEGEGALERGREWLRAFIKRVKANTGVNPVVYASSSVVIEQDLMTMLAEENCGLWCANYYLEFTPVNGYDYSGMVIGVPDAMMWQYTSSGRLPGFDDDLDLDVFFGDKSAWMAYASGTGEVPEQRYTIDQLAEQVWAGLWGDDDERRRRLTDAGYDYDAVQERVNQMAPASTYIVQSGDTLSEIAERLGVPMMTLVANNGIADPNVIYPGQKLTY